MRLGLWSVIGSALIVAACGTRPLVSVEGACEGRPRAAVTMFGADAVSQRFLDETIEDNVARCRQARPQARPDPRKVVEQKKPIAKSPAEKQRKKWRDYFRKKNAES